MSSAIEIILSKCNSNQAADSGKSRYVFCPFMFGEIYICVVSVNMSVEDRCFCCISQELHSELEKKKIKSFLSREDGLVGNKRHGKRNG